MSETDRRSAGARTKGYMEPPVLTRLEQWERHVHWFALATLWAGAAIVLIIIWHVAAPPSAHFLPAEQLRELRSMALTVAVTTAVTNHFQRKSRSARKTG